MKLRQAHKINRLIDANRRLDWRPDTIFKAAGLAERGGMRDVLGIRTKQIKAIGVKMEWIKATEDGTLVGGIPCDHEGNALPEDMQ